MEILGCLAKKLSNKLFNCLQKKRIHYLPEVELFPNSHISLETPIGWLKIEGNDVGITAVSFEADDPGEDIPVYPSLEDARDQLKEYFEGKRKDFDLNLFPEGTDFQISVWNALLGVPFGKTVSYADIAHAIQNDKAVRAVGAANGQNPISIVVPCHRVIGASGKLTGYAGGVWRKRWLLEHEAKLSGSFQQTLF